MSQHSLDEQIDQLYQLPLDEFTAARNALAKNAGGRASEVKGLEKPNVAAWAVNQLFWRERNTHDDLIESAKRRREAYRQMLAGKSADVREADTSHTGNIKKAVQAARKLLEEAGNKPTDAVLTAISETLDALPSAEPPGRLTKPLRRIGFGGLEGVPQAPAPTREKPAATPAAKEPATKPTAKDRQADEAKKREIAMTRERLRFAEAAEREAEESLERARRTVERTERTRERIEQELDDATKAAQQARQEEAASKAAHDQAVAERERLSRRASERD